MTPTLMQQNKVAITDIVIGERLRPVSDAGVETLVSSIQETGVMKDAIHIRKKKNSSLVLLAGAHRVEAARRLGWTEIEAKVWTDVTDDWAKLIEIDDNLAGAEMNALDTALFLAARKEVYERLHPETRSTSFKGNRFTGSLAADIMSVASFAVATAEKFGLTDRHVRRMIAAGTALDKRMVDALRAAPKPISLSDLTSISKLSEDQERRDVVARLSAGQAKSASDAIQHLRREAQGSVHVKDPVETALEALSKAFNRAPKEAHRRFVAQHFETLAGLISDLSNATNIVPMRADHASEGMAARPQVGGGAV